MANPALIIKASTSPSNRISLDSRIQYGCDLLKSFIVACIQNLWIKFFASEHEPQVSVHATRFQLFELLVLQMDQVRKLLPESLFRKAHRIGATSLCCDL